jgi:hypothetical protein
MERFVAGAVLVVVAGCQCGPAGSTFEAENCTGQTWAAPPGCAATDLLGKLRCVPNLTVVASTTAPASGYARYDLVFHQQVDVDNPDAGTFDQRAVLLYADAEAPVVLSTSGYGLSARVSELARTFDANQLSYEHRFFGPSRPVPSDWSQLTIRQAADDAHAMVAALRWIFPGRWINTGASKGGMTSVYHRRFHPCDVDATLAYVAPASYGVADPAYDAFLENVGGARWASCRVALQQLQRRLLLERAELLPWEEGPFYDVIPLEKAWELAVTELSFAFWQYTAPDDPEHGCSALPLADADAQNLVGFLDYHSSPYQLAGTDALDYYAGYYYQAQRELGAPAPPEAPVRDLLRWPGADTPRTYIWPGVPVPAFEPSAMTDIDAWLDAHGDRVMLVYGEFDPWSTHQIPLGRARDSYTYVAPGGNHGARLGTLAAADKTKALQTLSRWLDRAVVVSPMLRAEVGDPEPRVPR